MLGAVYSGLSIARKFRLIGYLARSLKILLPIETRWGQALDAQYFPQQNIVEFSKVGQPWCYCLLLFSQQLQISRPVRSSHFIPGSICRRTCLLHCTTRFQTLSSHFILSTCRRVSMVPMGPVDYHGIGRGESDCIRACAFAWLPSRRQTMGSEHHQRKLYQYRGLLLW